MEATVKLTEHAKQRMRDRFSPPLKLEDVAEVLRKGKASFFGGGCYVKYGNIGLILKSSLNTKYDYYVITVLDLKRNRFYKPALSPPGKSPFKNAVIVCEEDTGVVRHNI